MIVDVTVTAAVAVDDCIPAEHVSEALAYVCFVSVVVISAVATVAAAVAVVSAA
ncbi:hypothetical protein DPMN_084789 [Dreissena polymorpha]|uniref:Uncharacterized protein n=1 Tax=Dreissena polymorpha TaxID=45954 RepID=A0A9D3YBF6_DREPO|nr:hypothetical protein DPMN_084789 [Dreissena polymorpha]